MTPIHSAGDALLAALSNALSAFFVFIPRVVGAALIVLIGIFAGRLAGRLVTRSLRTLRFDQIAERAEIRAFLRNAGVRMDPAAAVGVLAQWFIYLIVFQAAASTLGFPQLTQVLNEIVGFIPRVVVAVVILMLGALAANLLARIVRGGPGTARFGDANLLAAVVRWGVIVVSVVAALSQMEIAPAIVNTLWIAFAGGVALAFAIAFGLGARDTMGSLAAGQLMKTDLQPGTRIAIDGQEGAIERIGAIFTTVNLGGRQLQVPNAELTRRSIVVGPSPGLAGPDGQMLSDRARDAERAPAGRRQNEPARSGR